MSDSEKNDKSKFDQARDWAKDHPLTVAGAAVGAIGGVYGAAAGAIAGAAVEKGYKGLKERQSDEDES